MAVTKNEFDVIVIGSGPGGSSCAALLAKRGFNVLLCEANAQAGGKAMTVRKQGYSYELWPIAGSPVYGSRFEQLQQHLELATATAQPNQDVPYALYYYIDREGHYQCMEMPRPGLIMDPAKLAEKSQEAFLDLMRWLQIKENEMGGIIKLATETAALTEEQISKLDDISYHDYLMQYDVPQSFYSYSAMAANVAYAISIDRLAASEYILTDRQMALNSGYYPTGGYGHLFECCVESFRSMGGTVKFGKRVEKILIENGRVKGVTTPEGAFYAPVVVSNAGIQPTVLKLVGSDYFNADYVKRVENLIPSFAGMGTRYFLKKPFFKEAYNLVFSDDSYLNTERMQRIASGEVPDDLLIFNVIPSNFDTSLSPEGRQCVLSLIFSPPDPDFKYTEAFRKKHDECMERAWPGFLSHVESRESYGSGETAKLTRERVLSGIGGEAIGLGQVVGQCGKHKPNPASPIPGLYFVGCDAGGRGVGTHQAVDSGFTVADLVEKHFREGR